MIHRITYSGQRTIAHTDGYVRHIILALYIHAYVEVQGYTADRCTMRSLAHCILLLSQSGTHTEPIGLDSQRLFDPQLVVRIFHREVEALQQQGQHEQSILQGKLLPYTTSCAIAKGLPTAGKSSIALSKCFVEHTCWLKFFSVITVHSLVAVHHRW